MVNVKHYPYSLTNFRFKMAADVVQSQYKSIAGLINFMKIKTKTSREKNHFVN